MEIVLVIAGVVIALIVGLTVVSAMKGKQAEARGREALQHTLEKNVQPVSLHPVVDPAKCVGTGACVDACPEVDVLSLIDGQARLANPTACIGHGECNVACPVDAISLVIGSERRGVDIPLVKGNFETDVPGLYIVGELGGMGLIYNAMTQALQCMDGIVKSKPPKVDGIAQVLVVGAGPAGLAASVAAIEAKLDYLTVDQESVGGTVLQYPRKKLVMTRPVKLPIYGKVNLTSVHKEDLLETWRDIVDKTAVQVRTGVKVEGVTRADDGVFTVATNEGELRAQRVVLALGRRGSPRKLGIPGEELSKVTYRLMEPEAYDGDRCLVIGGGDSAVEAAIALGESGARVHLAYRSDAFSRIKPKNQQRLDDAVAAGRVELRLKTTPKAIHKDAVELEAEGATERLDNDYVFVFAGGVLPTKLLEAAGVEVQTFKGEAFAPANA
jgi:thioredoxin reductase/ferredoxin